MLKRLTLVAALLAAPRLVPAQEELQPALDASEPFTFSVTVSPVHVAIGVYELTGEIRSSDDSSFAIIVGAGSLQNEGSTQRYSALEIGAQFRQYVAGGFEKGLQLGAEALYVSVEQSGTGRQGSGLLIGPFIGAKLTAGSGFTFDAQVGATFALFDERDTSGDTSPWVALLNLNVGWSF